MSLKAVTLVFLLRSDGHILLAMKKRGFGIGKWNGAGGKKEGSETMEEAAIRECEEEVGVRPTKLEARGWNIFRYEGKPEWDSKCWLYVVHEPNWTGTPRESEEMAPKWFAQSDIPYDSMWPDDRVWLPKLLAGESIYYDFHFDQQGKIIKYHVIEEEKKSDEVCICTL